MKTLMNSCLVVLVALAPGCRTWLAADSNDSRAGALKTWKRKNPVWRGVQLMVGSDTQAAALAEQLPKLAAVGVNAVILETDYNFEFKSHPELSSRGCVTRARAHELAAVARESGIRLIPQINCLGHQSWSRN